ncbi:MAG: hypothetical protein R3F59_12750 [Myxococcota bacterium]
MEPEKSAYVLIHRIDDPARHVLSLSYDSRHLPGWNDLVNGWSLGPASTGAQVPVEEPMLLGTRLGIFPASNHVILWGHVPPEHELAPFQIRMSGHRWVEARCSRSEADTLYCRFDRGPLRIGDHVVQFSYERPVLP